MHDSPSDTELHTENHTEIRFCYVAFAAKIEWSGEPYFLIRGR